MRTFPFDPWLDRFNKDPESTWNDFVTGRVAVPGFALATLSETLGTVFGGRQPDDVLIQKLDTTLTQWLDPFLAWDEDRRHYFGYSNYIQHLDQVFSTVAYLRLPQISEHLFHHLNHYSAILPSLTLASYLDPMAALYRVLAQSEHYCPRLQPLWLRLCRDAEITLEGYYLDIGLLGLRGIPSGNDSPPAWLTGLAAWLPHARSKKLFVRKLRSLRAMDSDVAKALSDWSEPLLQQLKNRINEKERINWWREELNSPHPSPKVTPKKSVGQRLSSPYPHELQELLNQFKKSPNFRKLATDLNSLLSRHEDFAQRTDDTYFLVRNTAEAANFLLKQSRTDMAKLASQLLRRTLVFAPWDIPSWHLLGRSLVIMGHDQAAEWVFWDTLRRDPNSIPTYTNLGTLLVRRGRWDEAEAVFKQALTRDPYNIPPLAELGQLLVRCKRWAEAETVLKHVLQRDSNNALASRLLEFIAHQRQKEKEAANQLHDGIDTGEVPTFDGDISIPDELLLSHRGGNQFISENIAACDFEFTPSLDGGAVTHMGKEEEDIETKLSPLRTPGLAKESDFFLSLQANIPETVVQRVQEQLKDLLQTNAQHGVVQFYGRRHGLLPPSVSEADNNFAHKKSWNLLEEFAQEKDLQKQIQQAIYLKNILPGMLEPLVRAATLDASGWASLVAWVEGVQSINNEKEKDNNLSEPSDRLLYNQLQAIAQRTGTLNPEKIPPDDIMRELCRQAAEFLLPAGTDPVMLEPIAA